MRRLAVATALGCFCACPTASEPAEPTTYAVTYFVDPDRPDDSGNGLTEATAFKTLDVFDARKISLKPNTKIGLKRGSVLPLSGTVQLHGSDTGWVVYGAYGEASLPKPILLGSVKVFASEWVGPDANGVFTLDWSPHLDTNGGRSAGGVEQGPGNLWFFEGSGANDRMTVFGFRRITDVGSASPPGDWYYDNTHQKVRLRWAGVSGPAFTEAAVNRVMLEPRGQRHVIVEDLDLRYGGNYAIKGSSSHHLRVRRVDMSFIGGGTKNRNDKGEDQYVRAGNGFEITGEASDIVVEDCRVHQAFDTGMDPQDVGAPVAQKNWVFRNNLVSYPGLAGFEVWARPQDANAFGTMSDILVENNTVLSAGRGWGYAQHADFGGGIIGAALFVNQSRVRGSNIVVRHNVFSSNRAVWAVAFFDDASRAFFRSFSVSENLWDLDGGLGAVLDVESNSYDLAAWQQNADAGSNEVGSLSAGAEFDSPLDPLTEDGDWLAGLPAADSLRPTHLGPFALHGDYRRTHATRGNGWGSSLSP